MKHITVSLDDEIYSRANAKAAALDTSLPAMIENFLVQLSLKTPEAVEPGEFERLEQLQKDVQCRITNFRAGDRLSRDELYDRKRS